MDEMFMQVDFGPLKQFLDNDDIFKVPINTTCNKIIKTIELSIISSKISHILIF